MTALALELGAEARDLDALQYHPNGGAWPQNMQGYSIPETTRAYGAVLLNADGEEFTDSLGPRDEVAQAIVDEVAAGRGVATEDGRPAVYLDTTRIPEADADDLAPVHAPPLPRGRDRPARGSRSSPTPSSTTRTAASSSTRTRETTLEGLYRLRRDRGRHARTQPDDGQLPARVLRLRAPRRPRRRRESERMTTTDRDRSVRRRRGRRRAPLRLGAEGHPAGPPRRARGGGRARDLRAGAARALDHPAQRRGRRRRRSNLVCQDTGIAVYTCRVGEHFPLHPARIYAALKIGTERATIEHPLRSNAVHTITRENTGPNTGHRLPIVHWEFIPDWDGLDVKCVPKGSGSENMSFLKMCVPADGVKGIKQFVLESIVGAGGKPCPPGIVGVGIGGSADYAMYLAKEAIARPIGTRNADPHVAQLEEELYGLLNETGIGPMGLGGDVTVLNCHIEHADTHMTLNPVAVNYQCWAARRASVHVDADGNVDFDREA